MVWEWALEGCGTKSVGVTFGEVVNECFSSTARTAVLYACGEEALLGGLAEGDLKQYGDSAIVPGLVPCDAAFLWDSVGRGRLRLRRI